MVNVKHIEIVSLYSAVHNALAIKPNAVQRGT